MATATFAETRTVVVLAIAILCSAPLLGLGFGTAAAQAVCPTPQPGFAYVDTDNDGCHTNGVDSGSIDTLLVEASSYAAPPGTGIVISSPLLLTTEFDRTWTADNDIWVNARLRGPSEIAIEAGGTTYVNDSITMKTTEFLDSSLIRLGCDSGCGPVIVAERVKLGSTGPIVIYDGEVGDSVRLRSTCGASAFGNYCASSVVLFRTTSIGDRVSVHDPNGAIIGGGTGPFTIGEKFKTGSAVFYEAGMGGPEVRDITIGAQGPLTIGARAKVRASGDAKFTSDGPIVFHERANLAGNDVVVQGSEVQFFDRARLSGTKDNLFAGYLTDVEVTATSGAVAFGHETRIKGGRIYLTATGGNLTVGARARLSVKSVANQNVELTGAEVHFGDGVKLFQVSAPTTPPVLVTAATGFSMHDATTKGGGLDVMVTGTGGALGFTSSSAKGAPGAMAVFRASDAGVCDLSGSDFAALVLDTSGCSSLTGP